MKSTIFCLSALSLLAAAQPSRHRRHEHYHRRQLVDTVTQVDYVTATDPDVVVYVDANNNPLYTSTIGQTAAPATTAAATEAAASPTEAAASPTTIANDAPASSPAAYTAAPAPVGSDSSSSEEADTTTAAAATPAADSSSAESSPTTAASASAPSGSSSSSNSGSVSGINGIAYSPYSGSYADNNVGCKTADQVNADFEQIDSSKYNLVRLYGTDCNQVANVLSAASAKNMKVMAGVYDITQVESELQTIISAANGNWDSFHTIAIGNELVNAGTQSVSAVTGAISTARGILGTAGFPGSIVTVDTFVAIMANPALCDASDYAAANAHPYFDGGVTAPDSGSWVLDQMQAVSSACNGKDTLITETGWPWSGNSNGQAVPSSANQQTAVDTIAGNVTSNVIMFTAFNDLWKAPGDDNVEQSWGMLGNSAAS